MNQLIKSLREDNDMNVQELIERLEECDPEAEVYLNTGDLNLVIVNNVKEHIPTNIVIIG